jgi:uncharacterized protein with GYD domain
MRHLRLVVTVAEPSYCPRWRAGQRFSWSEEESDMPTYIMLTTLTSEGAHTVHANPDRVAALRDDVAKFGCKIVAEYAVLGQYDFVTIVDAPDNETVAHLSVDLGSRGTSKTQTLPAISLDALMTKLKGPDQLGR